MWVLLPVLLLLSVALTSSCGILLGGTTQRISEDEVTAEAPIGALGKDESGATPVASAMIQKDPGAKTKQAALVAVSGEEGRRGRTAAPPESVHDTALGRAAGSALHLVNTRGLNRNLAVLQLIQGQDRQPRPHHWQQPEKHDTQIQPEVRLHKVGLASVTVFLHANDNDKQQHRQQQKANQVGHHSVVGTGSVGRSQSVSLQKRNENEGQQASPEEQVLSLQQQREQETESRSAKESDNEVDSAVVKNEETPGGAEDEYSEVERPDEEMSVETRQEQDQEQKSTQQAEPGKGETMGKEEPQSSVRGGGQPPRGSAEQAAGHAEATKTESAEAPSQRAIKPEEKGESKHVEQPETAEKEAIPAKEPSVGPEESAREKQGEAGLRLEPVTKQAPKGPPPEKDYLVPHGEGETVTVRGGEEEGHTPQGPVPVAGGSPAATSTAALKMGGEVTAIVRGPQPGRKAEKEAARTPEESLSAGDVSTSKGEEADLVPTSEKGGKSLAGDGIREEAMHRVAGKEPHATPTVPAEGEAGEGATSGAIAEAAAQPPDKEAAAAAAAPEEEAGSVKGGEEKGRKRGPSNRPEQVNEEGAEERREEEELPETLSSRATAVALPPETKREEELETGESAQEPSPLDEEAAAEAPSDVLAGGVEEGIPVPREEEKPGVGKEPAAAAPVSPAKGTEKKPEGLPSEAEEEGVPVHARAGAGKGAKAEQPEALKPAVPEEEGYPQPAGGHEEEQEEEEVIPFPEGTPMSPAAVRGPPEAKAVKPEGVTVEPGKPVQPVEEHEPAAAAAAEEGHEAPPRDIYAEHVPENVEGLTLPGRPEEEETQPEARKKEAEAAVEDRIEAAAAEGTACYSGRRHEAARRGLRLLRVVLSNRNFLYQNQPWCDMLLNKIDGPFSEKEVEFLLRAAAVSAASNRLHKNFRFCIATARSSPPRVKEGDSVLHAAAAASKPRLVELLLQYGAFPNMETLPRNSENAMRMGQRPLHYAVQHQTLENIETVLLLLQYGALIDSVDVRGRTPLMAAAEASGLHAGRFIGLLLDKGADVLAKDHAGLQALHYAAAADSADAVEHLLLRGAAPAEEDMRGNTPLHYAAMFNAAKALRTLLHHARGNYPDIDVVNESGKAATHLAAEPIMMDGLPRGVLPPLALEELLLHHGANPTARDHKQNTPLMRAASGGYTQMAKALLQIADPGPEAANMDGKTAFDLAMDRGRNDIAQLLKEATSGTTCTSVPKVRHATEYFSDSQYGTFLRVGDTVSYTCNKGFQMKGEPILTCMTRDDFSEFIPTPPTCVKSNAPRTLLACQRFYFVSLLLLGTLTL